MTGVVAQMFDNGNHMNDWGWGWGLLLMILIVVIIGLVAWALVRGGQQGGNIHDRAREILAKRLARGEITPDEYQERLRHLS